MLLPVTLSMTVPVTVAVLVIVPTTLALTATINTRSGATEPLSSAPAQLQVTCWPLAPQSQPVPVPAKKLIPAGKVSTISMEPDNLPGPRLVTLSV